MVVITPARAAVALAALVLACHALLPFTDYVSFDDRYMFSWVQRGELDSLHTFYSMCGGQIVSAYAALFSGLGDLVTPFKIAGVVFSLATGWLTWRVGVRSGFLTGAEALVVAGVAVAFPAYKLKGGFIYAVYDWTPAAFLLGTLLALRAEYARTAAGHLARRGLALALFTASFLMPSLLTFYGGFFWLLVLVHQRDTGRRWFQVPWGYVARRADYLVLPFVFYVVKNACCPTWGPYAAYNKPSLSASLFEAAYLSLPAVFTDPFTLFVTYPAAIKWGLAAAAAGAWLVGWRAFCARAGTPAEPTAGPAPVGGLLLFGAVLLVLGTFPYAAVGRTFGPTDLGSVYTPLVPLPVAVLTLGLVKLAGRAGPAARLLPPVFAAVGVCWAAAWWHNYFTMQAVEARNRALLADLHANPAARECTVYCIHNLYRVPRTFDGLHGWEWCFIEAGLDRPPRSYAYNGLPTASSTPAWHVRQVIEDTTLGFALRDVDPDGKQGIVIVRPRAAAPPAYVGYKYLALKYARPHRIEAYLKSLVEVEFYPAPWDHASIRKQAESRP